MCNFVTLLVKSKKAWIQIISKLVCDLKVLSFFIPVAQGSISILLWPNLVNIMSIHNNWKLNRTRSERYERNLIMVCIIWNKLHSALNYVDEETLKGSTSPKPEL